MVQNRVMSKDEILDTIIFAVVTRQKIDIQAQTNECELNNKLRGVVTKTNGTGFWLNNQQFDYAKIRNVALI